MKESPSVRKTQTYFEQIPVEKVKAMLVHLPESQGLRPPVSATLHHVLRCTICSQPVPVETAKTDSNGQAIHEECFIVSVTGKTSASGSSSIPRV
jgi:hypothetical protein